MLISQNNNIQIVNPNFRALPQKEVIRKGLASVQTGSSKKLFIKLSAIAGLSGIIAMVSSFFNKGLKADNASIVDLKNKYTEINNAYLTNPETVGTYLDITSASDSKIAELETKGKIGLTQNLVEYAPNIVTDIDITPEHLEKYVLESQDNKLNTILKQTEVIAANPNAEIVSKTLDEKINTLATEAEKLRTDEKTSELYRIFSEIAKLLSLSTLTEFYTSMTNNGEPEIVSSSVGENKEVMPEKLTASLPTLNEPENLGVVKEELLETSQDIQVKKEYEQIILPINDKVKLKVTLGTKPRAEANFFVTIKNYDKPETLQIYNVLASIHNEICGENRKEKRLNNGVEIKNSKLVELINDRLNSIKTLKINNQKTEIDKLLEEFNNHAVQEDYVVIAEEEEIYTTETFKEKILKQREGSEGYELLCNTFAKYSGLICSIYNSIQKESLRDNFLTKISEKDRSQELNQYIKIGGLQSKIDFISYLGISDFKKSLGLDVTVNDFIALDAYKDVTLKYSTYDMKEGKVYLSFREDANYKDRLETAVAYLKALYSIKQSDIVKPSNDEVSNETIINELKKKVSKDSEEYENILAFIGLKLKPNFAVQRLTETDIQSLIDVQLKDGNTKQKFELIVKCLKNENFDNFVQGTHGRMRFIERIVLEDKNTNEDSIEKLVESKIKKIKFEIETKYPIILSKYETADDNEYDKKKFSPQLKLGLQGKFILGLNNKGQIHTIYPAKTYKKY